MKHFKTVEGMLSHQFEQDGEKDSNGQPVKATETPMTETEFLHEKEEELHAKISNIYERQKYQRPVKFNQAEEGIHTYQTQDKEKIRFKSLSNKGGKITADQTSRNSVWGKDNPLQNKYNRLNHLKPGEFATIENTFSETHFFDFTSKSNNKINSADDIAFIFRKLENEAVEHAFAVYVDARSNAKVQWLSMGGITGTVIDLRLMIGAAEGLDAKDVYFVHNHPSGNLKASEQDRIILSKLKNTFNLSNVAVHGIIINLNSGKYTIFNEENDLDNREGFTGKDYAETTVPVFSFNKRSFLSSPLATTIHSSKDVAQFLSQQRFSSGIKRGYLLLDNAHRIVGNFFGTKQKNNEAIIEAGTLAGKYGAVKVIAYTNENIDASFYKSLKDGLNNMDIQLLDAMQIEKSNYVSETYGKYKSLADNGWVEDQNNIIYSNSENHSSQLKLNNMETKNENQRTMKEPVPESYENKDYLEKNLDYLANQVKYLGLGEDQKDTLKQKMEEGEEKFNLQVKKEFDGADISYTLHFDKSKESDMYFFNSYDAATNGKEQSVYLNKGKGFTAKETFNLMNDRAVYKELFNKNDGETFNAWIKLADVKEGENANKSRKINLYNKNYGYDLVAALSQHPIKELGNEDDKQKLIASLKKGNRQAVTFKSKEGEERKFVETRPKWKNVEIYNKDGNKMFIPHDQKIGTKNQADFKPVEKVSPSKSKAAGMKR